MGNSGKKEKTISKRQKALKKEFLEYVAENGIIQIACRKAGMGRQTYYRWIAEDQVFSRAVQEALKHGRETGCDMSESVIIGKIAEKDMGAAKFYLTHNDSRYMTPAKNQERREQLKTEESEELKYVPIDPKTLDEKRRALGREYEEKLKQLIIDDRLSNSR